MFEPGHLHLVSLPGLDQHQYLRALLRTKVAQVDRYAEVASGVEAAGDEHRRQWRIAKTLGHAAVALLLDGEHRRQLIVGKHAAVGFANLRKQRQAHAVTPGGRSGKRRTLPVDAHDLAPLEVRRQQRRGLRNRPGHQGSVLRPVPTFLPVQGLLQVRHRLAGPELYADRIHPWLLAGIEHFQQQAALRPIFAQGLRQPQFHGMMIGIVVLLADDHSRRGRQACDQLLRAQRHAAAQFDDSSRLRIVAPFRALPIRQRRQLGLAAAQQQTESEQANAHGDSFNGRRSADDLARDDAGPGPRGRTPRATARGAGLPRAYRAGAGDHSATAAGGRNSARPG